MSQARHSKNQCLILRKHTHASFYKLDKYIYIVYIHVLTVVLSMSRRYFPPATARALDVNRNQFSQTVNKDVFNRAMEGHATRADGLHESHTSHKDLFHRSMESHTSRADEMEIATANNLATAIDEAVAPFKTEDEIKTIITNALQLPQSFSGAKTFADAVTVVGRLTSNGTFLQSGGPANFGGMVHALQGINVTGDVRLSPDKDIFNHDGIGVFHEVELLRSDLGDYSTTTVVDQAITTAVAPFKTEAQIGTQITEALDSALGNYSTTIVVNDAISGKVAKANPTFTGLTTGFARIDSNVLTGGATIGASDVTSGIFVATLIPGLDAAKVASGTLNADRIPALDTSKVTTGEFDAARVPDLDAAKVASGTLNADRIPELNTSKVTSGQFDTARLPTACLIADIDGTEQTFNGLKTFSSPLMVKRSDTIFTLLSDTGSITLKNNDPDVGTEIKFTSNSEGPKLVHLSSGGIRGVLDMKNGDFNIAEGNLHIAGAQVASTNLADHLDLMRVGNNLTQTFNGAKTFTDALTFNLTEFEEMPTLKKGLMVFSGLSEINGPVIFHKNISIYGARLRPGHELIIEGDDATNQVEIRLVRELELLRSHFTAPTWVDIPVNPDHFMESTAQYCAIRHGDAFRVYIRGHLLEKSGSNYFNDTDDSYLFTIPTDHWPIVASAYLVPGGDDPQMATILVSTDGSVTLLADKSYRKTPDSTNNIFLNGIDYWTN